MYQMQPNSFKVETTTMWSFPNRGNWATHSGSYRGNWSPYIPRNLMSLYSKPGDWVLDQFLGSGTTLVEAKLLGRNAIGIDVNDRALEISKKNLSFECDSNASIFVKKGDARHLDFLKANSIDLICTHPPYANSVSYSEGIENDISLMEYSNFIGAMKDVAQEAYRVLKPGKICAVMMGDLRRHGDIVPLGMETMNLFVGTGFRLKEIIIKEQHNCRFTNYWRQRQKGFLLIAHEYIFVLRK